MSHYFMLPFSLSITLFIITSILLPRKASCVDYRYLACNPKTCAGADNGPNISFPFYIQGEQESYCGYPGFSLSCNNGQPILKLSDSSYIIHQIFYEQQSFLVSNAVFANITTTCIPPIQNLSLPEGRFGLSPYQKDLMLFYHCNSTIVNRIAPLGKKVACFNQSTSVGSTLALFKDDPLSVNASQTCAYRVVAPVQDMYRGEIGGLESVLKRGFMLNWTASNCSICKSSGGKCGFNESSYLFKCYCPDRARASDCDSDINIPRKFTPKVAIAASAAAAGILILCVTSCWFRRKFKSNKTRDHQKIETFLKNHGSLAPNRYRYSEVKQMMKAFTEKLGQGGYGSVFKGKLPDGRLVAVKILKDSKSNGEEFINEVASIGRTSHVNIVTLLGFCFEGSKRALIYEFMSNGSLEKYIYGENCSKDDRQLGWETLHHIAVGIARGLEYLHRGCNTKILHFDIKPHNILLDENFCPKISDFGLAKICTKKESIISMLGARGTVGYIAPEVFCRNFGGVSHKSDVYSYGMLVLEMVGGRKNISTGVDHTSEIYFPLWISKHLEQGEELGLYGIRNEEENQMARKMILTSLWCIQTDPSNRPPMSRVVEMLLGSLDSLQIPPRPILSSPSRSLMESVENSVIGTLTTM